MMAFINKTCRTFPTLIAAGLVVWLTCLLCGMDINHATDSITSSNGNALSIDGAAGSPNLFINGEPSFFQRSTDNATVSTTAQYVADRWKVKTEGGTLAHVKRGSLLRSGARSRYNLELDGASGVTDVTVM